MKTTDIKICDNCKHALMENSELISDLVKMYERYNRLEQLIIKQLKDLVLIKI